MNNILQRLNCRFKAEDSAAFLSAGEMQMVAIAKALFHNSNVISLDEPTASSVSYTHLERIPAALALSTPGKISSNTAQSFGGMFSFWAARR